MDAKISHEDLQDSEILQSGGQSWPVTPSVDNNEKSPHPLPSNSASTYLARTKDNPPSPIYANVTACRNWDGDTCGMIATHFHSHSTLLFLLSNNFCTLSDENYLGLTLMHVVAASGDLNLLSATLEFSDSSSIDGLKAQDDQENSVLHYVCMQETVSLKLLELILGSVGPEDVDAFVNEPNRYGNTPLLLLLQNPHFSVNPRSPDSSENALSPPFNAESNFLCDMTKFLLDHGANPTAKNKNGFNCLHFAENASLASLLIDHGASAFETTNDLLNAFSYACIVGRSPDFLSLILKCADVLNPAEAFRLQSHLLTATDRGKRTPLHLASYYGHVQCVKFLLQHVPTLMTINHANIRGNASIHAAAFRGHAEIVKLLLIHGVDASLLNAQGKTPADLAPPPIQQLIDGTWRVGGGFSRVL